MKFFLTAFCLSAILLSGCSKTNEFEDKQFDFISFGEDAIVSNQNHAVIEFYASDFDTDKSNWSIVLFDDDNAGIPVTIQTIESVSSLSNATSSAGVYKVKLQTSTMLPVGAYTLSITNRNTQQIHIDNLMVVKSNAVEEVTVKNSAINLSCIQNITKHLITSNNTVLVTTERIDEVSGVRIQKKGDAQSSGIDFSIENGKVAFSLPGSVTTGYYYISIEYNNLASDADHYKYALPVGKELLPEITSIDKEVYGADDVIIITGANFKYTVDPSLIPAKTYFNPSVLTELIFSDASGKGSLYDHYKDFTVNETGTEIQCAVSKVPFVSYIDRDDFDGTIAVHNGAYTSNSVDISIVR